jgi:hypothetical protein
VTPDSLADCIVAHALERAELSDGATPDAYQAALYPYDTPAARREMARSQYSCGLTCESILRDSHVDGTLARHGVTQDWLRVPYASRLGDVIVLQRQLGQHHGCWTDAIRRGDALPEAASMVELEGPVHVLTVIARDGWQLETVEGGQPDPITGHGSAIHHKRRQVVVTGGQLWLRDAGTTSGGRRVVGWLRAGELPCLP